MGADLITYLVTGPVKLKSSKTLRAKILKKAQIIIDAASKAMEDHDFDWQEDKHIGRFEEEDLEALADLDAEQVLANLYELWDGGFRDSSSRVITRYGKRFMVVVAGSETWGDEPDGSGYATLRDSIRLGLLKPLGID